MLEVFGRSDWHRAVKELAERDHSSANQFITHAIAEKVSALRKNLIHPKQIPRVHLLRHIGQFRGAAVGDDDIGAGLELNEVAEHFTPGH